MHKASVKMPDESEAEEIYMFEEEGDMASEKKPMTYGTRSRNLTETSFSGQTEGARRSTHHSTPGSSSTRRSTHQSTKE